MKIIKLSKRRICTFAVLLGMVPAGCSSEDQRTKNVLVGKWGWEHTDLVEGVFSGAITFYADGRYYQTLTGGDIGATVITYLAGRSFLGKWTVENGELILSKEDNSDSKNVQIFSVGNSGSGDPVKIKIDHCAPDEMLFSNYKYKWICKRK